LNEITVPIALKEMANLLLPFLSGRVIGSHHWDLLVLTIHRSIHFEILSKFRASDLTTMQWHKQIFGPNKLRCGRELWIYCQNLEKEIVWAGLNSPILTASNNTSTTQIPSKHNQVADIDAEDSDSDNDNEDEGEDNINMVDTMTGTG